jgi:hypothetical protein
MSGAAQGLVFTDTGTGTPVVLLHGTDVPCGLLAPCRAAAHGPARDLAGLPAIPDAKVEILEDVGDHVALGAPDRVADRIRELVRT